jgi:transcription termination/antitermination protein NusA
MSSEVSQQIDYFCAERGLDRDEVLSAIENAVAAAYRKDFGDREKAYLAEFDPDSDSYKIYQTITVVDEVKYPEREISLVQARLENPDAEIEQTFKTEISKEKQVSFGRVASQIAGQVFKQTVNSIKHSKMLGAFKDKVGEIVTGEIERFSRGGYWVTVGGANAFLAQSEVLSGERFKPGQLVKAVILSINEFKFGSSHIILSRVSPDFVIALMKQEIPELAAGTVLIDKIVRDPGIRTKVLVSAQDENSTLDPVGTCLGRKNTRILNVLRELHPSQLEKIDIILNTPEDLEGLVAASLEPAEVEDVEIDLENKSAKVYCYEEEASVAIGRRGGNINLAGKLLNLQITLVTIDSMSGEVKESEEKTAENETSSKPIISVG